MIYENCQKSYLTKKNAIFFVIVRLAYLESFFWHWWVMRDDCICCTNFESLSKAQLHQEADARSRGTLEILRRIGNGWWCIRTSVHNTLPAINLHDNEKVCNNTCFALNISFLGFNFQIAHKIVVYCYCKCISSYIDILPPFIYYLHDIF